MKVLLDTSVAIPSLWKEHPNHDQSVNWLLAASDGRCGMALSPHALIETVSVLTRLPVKPRLETALVWRTVERDLLSNSTLVEIPPSSLVARLSWCATHDLRGGILYDAMIALAAEIAAVDLLLTYNLDDFRRVWPAGAARIVSPDQLSPPNS